MIHSIHVATDSGTHDGPERVDVYFKLYGNGGYRVERTYAGAAAGVTHYATFPPASITPGNLRIICPDIPAAIAEAKRENATA